MRRGTGNGTAVTYRELMGRLYREGLERQARLRKQIEPFTGPGMPTPGETWAALVGYELLDYMRWRASRK